ncbi:phosphoribosylformylglycinamidine synthase, purS protein [Geoglobus ahangari]|uniref:Phosphoribosylformylglycinamidine synthase subunit PurS n=1 Tax=Geoglobus ahangari TaxID=113653 RepID=A0A0F7DBQ1_9EURY|nr:phosphoribosylformylglycinamidine synthase subunit PurS [Geoglobus ahangari]AKG91481.1 phosphoribosylformylglycinamidine synthase, purS protein [Geoglobus ahangari]NOY11195.1 phosphoribosylformylglycinamidine synthase subunit PurS [Archaeoglobi archaeon]
MNFTADVYISLKKGVVDPEGEATKKALNLLGFRNVKSVSSVKVFRIELEAKSREDAEKMIEEMCEKLLANPVIQDYSIRWVD